MPTNQEFLQALFKEDAPFVHVTDFIYDPADIPSDQHLIAWKGDWSSRYQFNTGQSNQYFTISIFNPDEKGIARRRKALFLRTRVIVLDDVREKLSIEAAQRLPEPAWILETSPGSEQWGYILAEPCADRGRVENLLDGLVANGLAPQGKDPGMKGVTRYVRLPDGYNTKAAKMINGQPYKCRMLEWHPERTTTLELLADPFVVNLDIPRREGRVDGAASIPDHPLLQIPDIITIKEVRSDGRFDITCPWVSEHTGEDDSGTAIFTNDDGSIGFKCHHGNCETKTARDFIRFIDGEAPGFGQRLTNWRADRVFQQITESVNVPPAPQNSLPMLSFDQIPRDASAGQTEADVTAPPPAMTGVEGLIDTLRRERPNSAEARQLSQQVLQLVEDIPTIERTHWHNEICDLMHWTKVEFKTILKDLRSEWYNDSVKQISFMTNIIFIKEQNRFYDHGSKIFYTPEAFQNSFAHEDPEARKMALQDGFMEKVDKMDFAPKQPQIFKENGIVYGNFWSAASLNPGVSGDCSRWLGHWDAMGWSEHRDHMLKWMAYTMLYPENKINHMLMLGSMEGTGKDYLLYPLIEFMNDYATVIDGHELLSGFNEYLLATKYLHVNETELGDHSQAVEVSNKIKPLATAPPNTLRVNQKGISPIKVRNIINISMTTNSQMPIKLNGPSRRIYAVWSELNVRDERDEMIPEWREYWNDRWNWMQADGVENCINYLLTQVDISDFNPGEAPPMTDFLRDIREASKSSAQQTIEAFVHNRIGAFGSDLVTAADVVETLRGADMRHADMMYSDASWFTPSKVGRVLRDMAGCVKLRGIRGPAEVRPWALRSATHYSNMKPTEIYNEYERQIKDIDRTLAIDPKANFKLVNN